CDEPTASIDARVVTWQNLRSRGCLLDDDDVHHRADRTGEPRCQSMDGRQRRLLVVGKTLTLTVTPADSSMRPATYVLRPRAAAAGARCPASESLQLSPAIE